MSRAGSLPVHELQLVTRNDHHLLPLPEGATISRSAFDAELVRRAMAAGVCFLPEVTAVVEAVVSGEQRTVSLRSGSSVTQLRGGIVVSAEGVLRSAVKHLPGMSSLVAAGSRLGLGAHVVDGSACYPSGRITMVVGDAGYVGLARFESTSLNIAAAVDSRALQAGRSMAGVMADILARAGQPIPDNLESAQWQGTPLLTSRPGRVAAERLFLVGDSAGYVEPFTGEGMATALESAAEIGPLVTRGVRGWTRGLIGEWTRAHRRIYRSRRWICSSLTWMLRRPWSVAASIQGCRWFPAVPRYLISRINRTSR